VLALGHQAAEPDELGESVVVVLVLAESDFEGSDFGESDVAGVLASVDGAAGGVLEDEPRLSVL
jgi:hypothetical protein